MYRIAKSIAENFVTIALIVVGFVFITASRTLPPPRFDPLGAGAYPMILGWLMVAFGALDLAKSAWQSWRNQARPQRPRVDLRQGLKTCFTLVLTIAYGFSMAIFEARFGIATSIYLVAASLTLQWGGLRRSLLLAFLFVAFAFTLEYLLKHVTYVDLP